MSESTGPSLTGENAHFIAIDAWNSGAGVFTMDIY